MRKFDTGILYTKHTDFFELNGNINMRLSREAAIDVCKEATKRGIVIWRWEGGIWHNPEFEARIDAIWDGPDWLKNIESIEENNQLAITCLEEEQEEYGAFLITLMPSN